MYRRRRILVLRQTRSYGDRRRNQRQRNGGRAGRRGTCTPSCRMLYLENRKSGSYYRLQYSSATDSKSLTRSWRIRVVVVVIVVGRSLITTMQSKPETVTEKKGGDGPRFEIKKWNAVAMWSWDICADTVSACVCQCARTTYAGVGNPSIHPFIDFTWPARVMCDVLGSHHPLFL